MEGPIGMARAGTDEYLRGQVELYSKRVAEVLAMAENLEEIGESVELFAYASEETCIERTGLTLAEHNALLGHCVIALEAAEFPWRVIPAESSS